MSTRLAGPMSTRLAGPMSTRLAGPMSTRLPGPMSTRLPGPMSTRLPGPPSTRLAGPMSTRLPGPMSTRLPGPMSTRLPGPMSTERRRCDWANSAPEYVTYHDVEWGTPLHGERELFERISLEAFQSGLSWLIILRKRPAFRTAFCDFDVDTVAGLRERDVQRLLADSGIVRNRAKIEATISNARAIRSAAPEGLNALLWSFAPATHVRPTKLAEVASTSPESTAMAKELKRRGFRFVGPTTAYALMQATGMVDDHISACWRAASATTNPTPA